MKLIYYFQLTLFPFLYIILLFIHTNLFYINKKLPLLGIETIFIFYLFFNWLFIFRIKMKQFQMILLIFIFIVCISFIISLVNSIDLESEYKLKNFLTIFDLYLYIFLLYNIPRKDLILLKKIFYPLFLFFLSIDLMASLYEIYLFYIENMSNDIIFYNDRYNAITFGDKTRIFGIFNSGLNNAFFLSLSMFLITNLFVINKSFLKRILLLTLLLLSYIVLIFTITRTPILIGSFSYFIFISYIFLKKFNKDGKILISITIFLVLMLLIFLVLSIFQSSQENYSSASNLILRIKEWNYFFSYFIHKSIINIIFGLNILQESLGYLNNIKFIYIDNLFLSTMISIGIVGLIFFLIIHFLILFRVNTLGKIILMFVFLSGIMNNIWYSFSYVGYLYIILRLGEIENDI